MGGGKGREGGGGGRKREDSSKFQRSGPDNSAADKQNKRRPDIRRRVADASVRECARAIRWRCNFIYPPSREEILRAKQKRATRTTADENPAGNSAARERRAT